MTLWELLDLEEKELTMDVEGNYFKERARRRRRAEFPGSTFVGPYEEEGIIAGVCGEQWLWAHRGLIRGVVLDMSTPRHYHEFVYQLPAVEEVFISDLCDEEVEKFGHRSKVDIVGDFCASELPAPTESFDTVLCMSILEHCEDPAAMVRNVGHLLRPGGVAFFRAPFAYTEGHQGPDYWRFCQEGFRLMARRAGLEVLETGQFGEMGGYFVLEIGEAVKRVPLATWMICRKGKQ